MASRENVYQKHVIDVLNERFPGCLVLKNDPTYIQGIPDLTVLYHNRWAFLEVKRSKTASHRPNQRFYVEFASKMSYGNFIFPENEERVLNELELALGSSG